MEQALSDFAAIIRALDQRIAALEKKYDTCCAAPAETTAETTAETVAETKPTVEISTGEVSVNLDEFSPDTIQNELWRTFCSISSAGNTAVVTYTGEYPRNIITYDDQTAIATYRNAGAAELRVIRAIEGTLLLTLQAGETGKLSYNGEAWVSVA